VRDAGWGVPCPRGVRRGGHRKMAVRTNLRLLLWSFLLGSFSASAADEITDYKFVAIQLATATADVSQNKYEYLRVYFTTNVDLAALSAAKGRDVRVAAYFCDEAMGAKNHATYSISPQVYDAYGPLKHDRAVKEDSNLDKFAGLYYFFLPTDARYAQSGGPGAFQIPYDLYLDVGDMCFETPGNPSNFFSNEAKIPAQNIKSVLIRPDPTRGSR